MSGPRLVMVTWLDAYTRGEWRKIGGSIEEAVCQSVGWLIVETGDYIELAGTIGDDDGETHANNAISIPRGMVKSMRDLVPKGRRK